MKRWAAIIVAVRDAFLRPPEVLEQPGNSPPGPLLPPVSMSDVCRVGVPIRILEPHGVDGNIGFMELEVLDHLVAQQAPKIIFEVGTFDGRTTINLAANAPTGATVYTIDLPRSQINDARFALDQFDRKFIDKDASGARFVKADEASKIVQLYGDTATFDFSPWYDLVDFVFVDASHSAPYVRNDTEVAFKLIGSRAGLIVWHDYNSWPGVTEVLNEYYMNDDRLRNLVHISGTTIAMCQVRPAVGGVNHR
jgi:predicted O-methyltransferase YrrM